MRQTDFKLYPISKLQAMWHVFFGGEYTIYNIHLCKMDKKKQITKSQEVHINRK